MREVNSAGLSTTVFPVASAGAIFHASISSGKFHGMICPPRRPARAGKLRVHQLGPSGVVIEVPCDERNVDVAALADRLAVVERLHHREQARMLLDQPRQRIEIRARPCPPAPTTARCAARAAFTAAPTSAAEACATDAEKLAGGGVHLWKASPPLVRRHAPPMKSPNRCPCRSSHSSAGLADSGAGPSPSTRRLRGSSSWVTPSGGGGWPSSGPLPRARAGARCR